MDILKQSSNKPVNFYYSRFKRLIKRIDAGATALQDPQKLYYFKKGLRAEILPILLTHAPADLAALLTLARTHEQGMDFATNANPGPSTSKAATYDKEIEQNITEESKENDSTTQPH